MIQLVDIAIIGATCLVTSSVMYIFLMRKNYTSPPKQDDDAVFLFDEDRLIDASDSAEAILAMHHIQGRDWEDLRHLFGPRFPNFPETQPTDMETLPIIVDSQDFGSASRLYIEAVGDRLRLRLSEAPIKRIHTAELFKQRGWEAQIDRMRSAVNHAPYPIWQTTTNGRIIWVNAAYENLLMACGLSSDSDQQGITYPDLFKLPSSSSLHRDRYRASVKLTPGNEVLWYEVNAMRSELHTMHYAIDINAVVQSEKAQREFVQTLTKTFAQLSIGLAVFDRKRELTLFNPALTELTELPTRFLANRPSLRSFFDHLRDAQIMPEPRSYRDWHDDLTALASAAANGRYMETWTLPSGLTYRVSGRPHPDGAIVFLFEDISAEISLSRRFRADMALNQSVLDQLQQPIAVFTANGEMQFNNSAYETQWQNLARVKYLPESLTDSLNMWEDCCDGSIDWDTLREKIGQDGLNAISGTAIHLAKGQKQTIWVSRISNGASLICFAPHGSKKPVLHLMKTA